MYKIILVDDEIEILEGMKNGIQWGKFGFKIIGTAKNGQEAIDIIKEEKPHIVFSDISMPKMNGLELMEYLNKNYPKIKIIISSGYNDTKYLSMAIKNGVKQYLLKPTDIFELEEILKKMKNILDTEQNEKQEINLLKESLKKSKDYMYKVFLNNFIKGHKKEAREEIQEKLKDLKIDYKKASIVVLEAGNIKRDTYFLLEKVEKYINDNFEDAVFFLDSDHQITGILNIENILTYREDITKYISIMQEEILENFGIFLSCGVGQIFTDIYTIPKSYNNAKESLLQKLFLGDLSIIFYEDIKLEKFYYMKKFNQKELKKYIETDNKDLIELEITSVFKSFENKMIKESEYVDIICLESLYDIYRWLHEKYSVDLEVKLEQANIKFKDIYTKHTLKDKLIFMQNCMDLIGEAISENKDSIGKTISLIYVIKEYIDENYEKHYMSLDYVAEKFKKNSAYISKLFKKELGINFSDYITTKRIEKSKELLTDYSLKIYEIAKMVGYIDVSTYIRVFKKNTGISPNEYRTIPKD